MNAERLARELIAQFGPDEPLADRDRVAYFLNRFDCTSRQLEAARSKLPPSYAAKLALAACDDLRKLLALNAVPAAMETPIVSFLARHAERGETSVTPVDLDLLTAAERIAAAEILDACAPEFCREAFDVSFRGRRTCDDREAAAVSVYVIARDHGIDEDAASVLAFDAYFGKGAHSKDIDNPCGPEDGCKNQAEQTMKKVIHPLLRRAGVRATRKAGRKPG